MPGCNAHFLMVNMDALTGLALGVVGAINSECGLVLIAQHFVYCTVCYVVFVVLACLLK